VPLPCNEAAAVQILKVADGEPTDIADVVRKLTDLQAAVSDLQPLGAENPIADFNHLYTIITERILTYQRNGGFNDPEFLTVLDIEFARRYFDALRQWATDSGDVPRSWTVLFSRYRDGRLRSLPCAVAGVNAHINYDLPFAVAATWRRLGFSGTGSPQHQDFVRINEVFRDEIPALRRGYLGKWQRVLDTLNLNLDDWYQNALVQLTRGKAWEHALNLWTLQDDRFATELLRDALDHQTATVGRLLLSRLGSFIQ